MEARHGLALSTELDGRRAPAEKPELRLLIAYDDCANRRRAVEFSERLDEDFGRIVRFVPRFLRFEELTWAHAVERVNRETMAADMLIVAADEGEELPRPVREWLKGLPPKGQPGESALVALLRRSETGRDGNSPVRDHLRQVAQQSGRSFLCNLIEWGNDDASVPAEVALRRLSANASAAENGAWQANNFAA